MTSKDAHHRAIASNRSRQLITNSSGKQYRWFIASVRRQLFGSRTRRAAAVIAALIFVAGAVAALMPGRSVVQVAIAASPSSGSIGPAGPVPPFTGSWTGTATGGVTTDPLDGEAGCTEGITCDTFTLTVLPGVYTGKVLPVDLTFNVADDYDLVIYKGGTCPASGKCNGQLVSSSGNGATNGILGEEHAAIDPNVSGSGDYKVRVV